MKMSKNTHRWIGLQNSIFYVLFIAVVVLLGFVGQRFNWQADWTQGSRNSLSTPTQTLLKGLDKPLKFIAYIPDDPALQLQLNKLVTKYQRVKVDTTMEFVNPDLDPARAKQDGIQYAGQDAFKYARVDKTPYKFAAPEVAIANRRDNGGQLVHV